MADPLSLVALGAAVGGAAGKFVEKAWNSGEKWITSYFADHRPKAIAQAQANSAEFLTVQSSRPAYGGPLTFGVRSINAIKFALVATWIILVGSIHACRSTHRLGCRVP